MDRGFSFVETLFAAAIAVSALVGLAQLSAASIRVNQMARSTTFAAVLAAQKLEQLQSLQWTFDEAGTRISDTSTDTTVTPERPTGGTGLAPSPADALIVDTAGYSDVLDAYGRTLGGQTPVPPQAAYVRRWSVEMSSPDDLLIQVSVVPSGTPATPAAFRIRAGEARLSAFRTRTSR